MDHTKGFKGDEVVPVVDLARVGYEGEGLQRLHVDPATPTLHPAAEAAVGWEGLKPPAQAPLPPL